VRLNSPEVGEATLREVKKKVPKPKEIIEPAKPFMSEQEINLKIPELYKIVRTLPDSIFGEIHL
jgi:hypothetical protein